MDNERRIITTQSMLAIESAAKALAAHRQGSKAAVDFEDTTVKLKAHYARERGMQTPDVTLELLRQRHEQRRKEQ